MQVGLINDQARQHVIDQYRKAREAYPRSLIAKEADVSEGMLYRIDKGMHKNNKRGWPTDRILEKLQDWLQTVEWLKHKA